MDAETWVIKTSDGEVYNLNTKNAPEDYDNIYNLLIGVEGHAGIPITIQSDVVMNMAGSEFRRILRGDRTIFLPLLIRGANPQEYHRNLSKIRKSLNPENEAQLWITNVEGETKMLYIRYLKGFESTVDDEKHGPNWIKVPLYVVATDPFFYDPPGSELIRTIVPNPFSADFLTPTVVVTAITEDVTGGGPDATVINVESVSGFELNQKVEIIGGGYRETCLVNGIDEGASTITLKGYLNNDYYLADSAYVQVMDETEIFVTVFGEDRTLNMGCNFVIFWMRGCPPCYTAVAQLAEMKASNSNLTVTKVEIQDAGGTLVDIQGSPGNTSGQSLLNVVSTTGCTQGMTVQVGDSVTSEMNTIASVDTATTMYVTAPLTNTYTAENSGFFITDANMLWEADGIGMTAAKALYPAGYEFATNCGPPLPKAYHAIDDIMPAVIALYRQGIFIKAWCGVHTTQADPIATNELEDACGPRISWRISRKYIGDSIVINNDGDSTAYPIWTIVGPGSDLTLTNMSTGQSFHLEHDIIAGETVVIDCREFAHTCGSTSQVGYEGVGYWSTEECPTCHGSGVIPAACCGGTQACPDCHGTGTKQFWVASSSGSANDPGGLFNLRPKIDIEQRIFWGFRPGPNVIKVMISNTDISRTSLHLSLVRRYEGV